VADDRFQIMSIPGCNPVLGQLPKSSRPPTS
jgi:hypothetical protein